MESEENRCQENRSGTEYAILLETIPDTAFVTSQSVAILGFDGDLAQPATQTVE